MSPDVVDYDKEILVIRMKETAKLKARLREALSKRSCNDGCVFWPNQGMHTNGGCRHLRMNPTKFRKEYLDFIREIREIALEK